MKRSGFTLVELLVVCVIVGITLAIAGPRFAQLRAQYDVEESARRLQLDLDRARTAAVRANAPVVFAKLNDSAYTVNGGERALPHRVKFSTGTAVSVSFPPFGPMVTGSATFVISRSGASKTVSVSTLGLVSVR